MLSTAGLCSLLAAPACTRPAAHPVFKRSPATAGGVPRHRAAKLSIACGSRRPQTDTLGTQQQMARTRSQSQRQAGPGFFGRHDNVFLYVPNLIGAPQRLLPTAAATAAAACPTLPAKAVGP